MGILLKQECIPIGCVPPARLPYPIVSDLGGLPNAPRCKPPSADTPWMQTPPPGGRPLQWRIYIVKFWTRAPPGGPNSFNSMQFLGKFGKIVCWRPPWRVGAPSSGKSWIRHCTPGGRRPCEQNDTPCPKLRLRPVNIR